MADRQRTLGFDHASQVEALGVLHREDQAFAGAEGGIGGDDIGMLEARHGADFAEEAFEHAGGFDDLAADDLEDLVAAQDVVVREEDQSHSAAAQLTDDLVVGVFRQLLRD